MFELTEKGKPIDDSSMRHLVPSPAKEPASVEKPVDAEPQPAPVPSVEGQFCSTLPLKEYQQLDQSLWPAGTVKLKYRLLLEL